MDAITCSTGSAAFESLSSSARCCYCCAPPALTPSNPTASITAQINSSDNVTRFISGTTF